MASIATTTARNIQQGDWRSLIDNSRSLIYHPEKGQAIYTEKTETACIFVVEEGSAIISRPVVKKGETTIFSIAKPGDLFGLIGFTTYQFYGENANAHENTKVRAWFRQDIENQVLGNPRLGSALLVEFSRALHAVEALIDEFVVYSIRERLLRTLMRLAGSNTTPTLPYYTQQQISNMIGTSREIVTHELGAFKKLGWIHWNESAKAQERRITILEWNKVAAYRDRSTTKNE